MSLSARHGALPYPPRCWFSAHPHRRQSRYSNQAVARLRSPGTERLPSKLAIMEADMFRMESLPSCFRIRDPFVNSFGKNILAPRGIRFLCCEKIESIRRPKAVNSKNWATNTFTGEVHRMFITLDFPKYSRVSHYPKSSRKCPTVCMLLSLPLPFVWT